MAVITIKASVDKKDDRLKNVREVIEILNLVYADEKVLNTFKDKFRDWTCKANKEWRSCNAEQSDALHNSKFVRVLSTTAIMLCLLESLRSLFTETSNIYFTLSVVFYMLLVVIDVTSAELITYICTPSKFFCQISEYFENVLTMSRILTHRMNCVKQRMVLNTDARSVLQLDLNVFEKEFEKKFSYSLYSLFNVYGIFTAYLLSLSFNFLQYETTDVLKYVLFFLINLIAISKMFSFFKFLRIFAKKRAHTQELTVAFISWFHNKFEMKRILQESSVDTKVLSTFTHRDWKMSLVDPYFSFLVFAVTCEEIFHSNLNDHDLEKATFGLLYGQFNILKDDLSGSESIVITASCNNFHELNIEGVDENTPKKEIKPNKLVNSTFSKDVRENIRDTDLNGSKTFQNKSPKKSIPVLSTRKTKSCTKKASKLLTSDEGLDLITESNLNSCNKENGDTDLNGIKTFQYKSPKKSIPVLSTRKTKSCRKKASKLLTNNEGLDLITESNLNSFNKENADIGMESKSVTHPTRLPDIVVKDSAQTSICDENLVTQKNLSSGQNSYLVIDSNSGCTLENAEEHLRGISGNSETDTSTSTSSTALDHSDNCHNTDEISDFESHVDIDIRKGKLLTTSDGDIDINVCNGTETVPTTLNPAFKSREFEQYVTDTTIDTQSGVKNSNVILTSVHETDHVPKSSSSNKKLFVNGCNDFNMNDNPHTDTEKVKCISNGEEGTKLDLEELHGTKTILTNETPNQNCEVEYCDETKIVSSPNVIDRISPSTLDPGENKMDNFKLLENEEKNADEKFVEAFARINLQSDDIPKSPSKENIPQPNSDENFQGYNIKVTFPIEELIKELYNNIVYEKALTALSANSERQPNVKSSDIEQKINQNYSEQSTSKGEAEPISDNSHGNEQGGISSGAQDIHDGVTSENEQSLTVHNVEQEIAENLTNLSAEMKLAENIQPENSNEEAREDLPHVEPTANHTKDELKKDETNVGSSVASEVGDTKYYLSKSDQNVFVFTGNSPNHNGSEPKTSAEDLSVNTLSLQGTEEETTERNILESWNSPFSNQTFKSERDYFNNSNYHTITTDTKADASDQYSTQTETTHIGSFHLKPLKTNESSEEITAVNNNNTLIKTFCAKNSSSTKPRLKSKGIIRVRKNKKVQRYNCEKFLQDFAIQGASASEEPDEMETDADLVVVNDKLEVNANITEATNLTQDLTETETAGIDSSHLATSKANDPSEGVTTANDNNTFINTLCAENSSSTKTRPIIKGIRRVGKKTIQEYNYEKLFEDFAIEDASAPEKPDEMTTNDNYVAVDGKLEGSANIAAATNLTAESSTVNISSPDMPTCITPEKCAHQTNKKEETDGNLSPGEISTSQVENEVGEEIADESITVSGETSRNNENFESLGTAVQTDKGIQDSSSDVNRTKPDFSTAENILNSNKSAEFIYRVTDSITQTEKGTKLLVDDSSSNWESRQMNVRSIAQNEMITQSIIPPVQNKTQKNASDGNVLMEGGMEHDSKEECNQTEKDTKLLVDDLSNNWESKQMNVGLIAENETITQSIIPPVQNETQKNAYDENVLMEGGMEHDSTEECNQKFQEGTKDNFCELTECQLGDSCKDILIIKDVTSSCDTTSNSFKAENYMSLLQRKIFEADRSRMDEELENNSSVDVTSHSKNEVLQNTVPKQMSLDEKVFSDGVLENFSVSTKKNGERVSRSRFKRKEQMKIPCTEDSTSANNKILKENESTGKCCVNKAENTEVTRTKDRRYLSFQKYRGIIEKNSNVGSYEIQHYERQASYIESSDELSITQETNCVKILDKKNGHSENPRNSNECSRTNRFEHEYEPCSSKHEKVQTWIESLPPSMNKDSTVSDIPATGTSECDNYFFHKSTSASDSTELKIKKKFSGSSGSVEDELSGYEIDPNEEEENFDSGCRQKDLSNTLSKEEKAGIKWESNLVFNSNEESCKERKTVTNNRSTTNECSKLDRESFPLKYRLKCNNLDVSILDSHSLLTLRFVKESEDSSTPVSKNRKLMEILSCSGSLEEINMPTDASSLHIGHFSPNHPLDIPETNNIGKNVQMLVENLKGQDRNSDDRNPSTVSKNFSCNNSLGGPNESEVNTKTEPPVVNNVNDVKSCSVTSTKDTKKSKPSAPCLDDNVMRPSEDNKARVKAVSSSNNENSTIPSDKRSSPLDLGLKCNDKDDFHFESDGMKINYGHYSKFDSIYMSFRKQQGESKLTFKTHQNRLYLKTIDYEDRK